MISRGARVRAPSTFMPAISQHHQPSPVELLEVAKEAAAAGAKVGGTCGYQDEQTSEPRIICMAGPWDSLPWDLTGG